MLRRRTFRSFPAPSWLGPLQEADRIMPHPACLCAGAHASPVPSLFCQAGRTRPRPREGHSWASMPAWPLQARCQPLTRIPLGPNHRKGHVNGLLAPPAPHHQRPAPPLACQSPSPALLQAVGRSLRAPSLPFPTPHPPAPQAQVLEALQAAVQRAEAAYPTLLEQDLDALQQQGLPWWVLLAGARGAGARRAVGGGRWAVACAVCAGHCSIGTGTCRRMAGGGRRAVACAVCAGHCSTGTGTCWCVAGSGRWLATPPGGGVVRHWRVWGGWGAKVHGRM